MEVTVDIKEGGQMETITSYSGEEPEADQSEWKIENDKLLMTYSDQTVECEYADGKITITADGTTMIQRKPTAMIFSIYYDWDEYQSEYDYSLDINIARDLIAQTDEGSYYLGLGMSLWYTGTDEYIEGRNCPVFVLGTDHEDHFTKEHYYAVGDNVVYYYDPSGDAWLLLGAG